MTSPLANVTCVVCGASAVQKRVLSGDFIRNSLARLFDEPMAGIPAIRDYESYHCPSCTLEFTNPMVPGDNAFYEWAVRHHGYYPLERWGWADTKEMVMVEAASKKDGPLTIVDVGCGEGAFLSYMRDVPNVRPVGIDTTQSSIELCRQAGLEAYPCDLEGAQNVLSEGADIVSAFHCLEHVSDPVAFVLACKALLKDNGRVVIATPYSPMSIEANWYDPLNHPPHHLTRWNEAAYAALAERAGMRLEIRMAPAASAAMRTFSALRLRTGQTPFVEKTKAEIIRSVVKYALLHPLSAVLEFRAQISRPRVADRTAPDEVMAILLKTQRV